MPKEERELFWDKIEPLITGEKDREICLSKDSVMSAITKSPEMHIPRSLARDHFMGKRLIIYAILDNN